jgi:hypothetical protein
MSNYSQSVFFGPKDSLTPGDPLKKIKGTEIDAELSLLSTAIATKADNTGPTSSFTSLTDPGADRLVFWDDSASVFEWLSPIGSNSGLTIAGTSMTVDISGLTLESTLTSAHYFMIHNGTALRKVQVSQIPHNSLTGYVANEHINHTSVSISAGTGLSGGGTIAANRTLSLDTGSTLNIDHATVSVSAGTGLTGGGTIEANRTLSLDTSSTRNTDHASVSISGGGGITGGGTLAANRTLTLDVDSLSARAPANVANYDSVCMSSNSTTYKALVRDLGPRQISVTNKTLELSDMNADFLNASGTNYTLTVPTHASVPISYGVGIGIRCYGSGKITVAASPGVTIYSLDGRLTVKANGGAGELRKMAGDNIWMLCGALE